MMAAEILIQHIAPSERDKVNRLLDAQREKLASAFLPLMKMYGDRAGDYGAISAGFTVPVGPKTHCSISFDGPVSIHEMEALLAHIAFYKVWFSEDQEDDAFEPVAEFRAALKRMAEMERDD